MTVSVLSRDPAVSVPDEVAEPGCFADLNLGQFVDALVAGREQYQLRPLLHSPLTSADDARYRQDAVRDLEQPAVRQAVDGFAQRMRAVRAQLALAARAHYQLQRSRLFLAAAQMYCDAVEALARELAAAGATSAAFRAFGAYLTGHVASPQHAGLHDEVRAAEDALAQVRYTLLIRGSRIRVSAYTGEADYSEEVRATFAKFEQAKAASHRSRFPDLLELDHIEAAILDRVARLFPEAFGALAEFFAQRQGFIDPVVGRFAREVQFYLAYLDYAVPVRAAGLSFCYPELSQESGTTLVAGTFDLVLAAKLVADRQPVVGNDISLAGGERLLVVTGPNQGGKTTYARAFGQVHYLASLGLPVPGSAAVLGLPDEIFTHFERAEDITTLSGKLADDLIRLRQIVGAATGCSVVILNEIFTSTTAADALALSTSVLRHVAALDCRCVCVTFLDELASFGPQTVSMVASVVPGNPAQRTFRLERRPADGVAYAEAVADKYGLSYQHVLERVAS